MPIVLLLTVLVQLTGTLPAVEARRLTMSTPATIARIPVETIPGAPVRLSWSPDARRVYLRAVKTDRWGNQTIFHFEISVDTGQVTSVEGEPEWSARYWAWKSAQSAPGAPDFRISYETREERKTATGIVNAGAMAQSGGDPSLGSELGPQGQAIAQGVMQGQMVRTTTLKLKGRLVGEFVNMTAIPGLTFGWAPGDMAAVAFAGNQGRLTIMDRAGRTREMPKGRAAILPAWSDDGRRIAWVERQGRKELLLVVTEVSAKR